MIRRRLEKTILNVPSKYRWKTDCLLFDTSVILTKDRDLNLVGRVRFVVGWFGRDYYQRTVNNDYEIIVCLVVPVDVLTYHKWFNFFIIYFIFISLINRVVNTYGCIRNGYEEISRNFQLINDRTGHRTSHTRSRRYARSKEKFY